MSSAVQSIKINATPAKCYKVIWDFENYPEYIDDLNEVEVKNKKSTTCEVTYHIKIIKDITYTLNMKGTKSKKIEWSFVNGDFMKDNHGFWDFKEIKKGVTEATYSIDVSLG
ncbi:hypothetical protein BVY03_02490, partial [bacterium K02(2017)]